ncbi:MAG TPA: hypothetical protein VG755_25530 [Nannocystaceae bacterium]|nr:hypothetical protein [Nannocystaceae bacterium]
MTKTLGLASLLLAAACIINTDDDGNNETSGNTTANTQTTTATTAGTGDSTDATNASTTVGTSESTAADSSTAAAESSTGAAGACGWGATGEKTTPMGYICGGDGADPDAMIDQDCASYGVDLVEGGECGGNMGITGAGCCDENGDVWYCADDGGMPRLFTEDC